MRTKAINNARILYLSLVEFDSDYGAFPSAKTAEKVTAEVGTKIPLKDTSSNQLFRQLLVTGVKTEKFFSFKAPGQPGPDDNFQDDAHILAPGECDFSYITGLGTNASPSIPIVMAPLIKGTTTFDPKPLGGKAIVLFLDGVVRPLPIEKDGKVLVDGKDLFDPAQPYWGGKKPEIRYPE